VARRNLVWSMTACDFPRGAGAGGVLVVVRDDDAGYHTRDILRRSQYLCVVTQERSTGILPTTFSSPVH